MDTRAERVLLPRLPQQSVIDDDIRGDTGENAWVGHPSMYIRYKQSVLPFVPLLRLLLLLMNSIVIPAQDRQIDRWTDRQAVCWYNILAGGQQQSLIVSLLPCQAFHRRRRGPSGGHCKSSSCGRLAWKDNQPQYYRGRLSFIVAD